ncbi:unnamed protein product [Cylindrotheca closterium]|uniref:SGNH domain-containing protein n=1 Tax=Cylindrotheca closterium TaxID=2856 RepID=A0AAD2G0B4_9STRA|nr:unnamed protein product [Cylindrotheca closterium]
MKLVGIGRIKTRFIETEPKSSLVSADDDSREHHFGGCQPLTGRWVHVGRNRTFHAPVCCGWDRGAFRRFPKECGYQKRKPIEGFYRGSAANDVYTQMGGNACRDASFLDEWEWQDPALLPFKSQLTCQKLANRTVLLLGDSTMLQTATTLMNALKSGGCAPQIMVQKADTLIKEDLGRLNRGLYWMDAVRSYEPDIVIVNSCHHIARNAMDDYQKVLHQVQADILDWNRNTTSKHNKKTAFVWKTANPGGCSDKPLFPDDPLLAARTRNFSFAPDYTRHYHHVTFERDQYACNHWTGSKQEMANTFVLDMRMLYSRSDAHPGKNGFIGDCLHYKSPGPLDVIAPLFQQLLDRIDSMNSK